LIPLSFAGVARPDETACGPALRDLPKRPAGGVRSGEYQPRDVLATWSYLLSAVRHAVRRGVPRM